MTNTVQLQQERDLTLNRLTWIKQGVLNAWSEKTSESIIKCLKHPVTKRTTFRQCGRSSVTVYDQDLAKTFLLQWDEGICSWLLFTLHGCCFIHIKSITRCFLMTDSQRYFSICVQTHRSFVVSVFIDEDRLSRVFFPTALRNSLKPQTPPQTVCFIKSWAVVNFLKRWWSAIFMPVGHKGVVLSKINHLGYGNVLISPAEGHWDRMSSTAHEWDAAKAELRKDRHFYGFY